MEMSGQPHAPTVLTPNPCTQGPVSRKNILVLLGIESWLTRRSVGSEINITTELPRVPRLYFKNGKLFLPVFITPRSNKVSRQINTGRILLLLPVHCLAGRNGSLEVPQIQTACIKWRPNIGLYTSVYCTLLSLLSQVTWTSLNVSWTGHSATGNVPSCIKGPIHSKL